MRSFGDIVEAMEDGHYTFSNMGEFEHWAVQWCARCTNEDGCPIVDAALIRTGKRPAEWVPTDLSFGPFVCTEFESNE